MDSHWLLRLFLLILEMETLLGFEANFCGFTPELKPEKYLCDDMKMKERKNKLSSVSVVESPPFDDEKCEPQVYKWMAFMNVTWEDNSVTQCSGVLVRNSEVVTSAQCIKKNGILGSVKNVLLGIHDLHNRDENVVEIPVESIKVHEEFDQTGRKENNLAIVYLSLKMNWAVFPNIRPICLPSQADESNYYEQAILTGWRVDEDAHQTSPLNQELIKVNQLWKCEQLSTTKGFNWDSKTMLCGYLKTRRPIIEGGVLIARKSDQMQYHLLGLISENDTYSEDLLAFSKITSSRLLNWINHNIENRNPPTSTVCRDDTDCTNPYFPLCSQFKCSPKHTERISCDVLRYYCLNCEGGFRMNVNCDDQDTNTYTISCSDYFKFCSKEDKLPRPPSDNCTSHTINGLC